MLRKYLKKERKSVIRKNQKSMLRCRSSLLLVLRMLSSSSSPLTSNPNFHLPIPSQPISNLSLKTPLSRPCASSQSQRMRTASPKCFSATKADPIPISLSDQAQPHCQNHQEPDSYPLVVVSFYKFADFPDHADLRKPLKQLCQDLVLFYSFIVYFFTLKYCSALLIYVL